MGPGWGPTKGEWNFLLIMFVIGLISTASVGIGVLVFLVKAVYASVVGAC